MGNFLDTPITEKETEVGEDGKCSYGLSAMQGWRAQMEDDHIQMLSVSDALPNVSLFGVFDGHGGDMVAHYSARHFPKHLTDALDAGDLKPDLAGFDGKAKAAFESSLMALDNELQHLQDVASGQDQSGSTSVQCLISPTSIVCANTGDSRAVLARGGDAVPLSHDHKPYNPEEKARIEAAGSHVKFNRVNGDLAVSRALGDFVYKRCETVAADRQAVTAFPEVITVARQADDEFAVIACDGIWDVMSSQEVVEKVHAFLANGRPPPQLPDADANDDAGGAPMAAAAEPPAPPAAQRPWDLGAVCEELIDHCLRLGSRDNMSVVIVLFQKGLLKPQPA